MIDKNGEELNVGDFVNLSSSFALGLADTSYGIVARIDKYSGDADNVVVLSDTDGMPQILPAAASKLTKAKLTEEQKYPLQQVQKIFNRMEDDLRFA